MGDTTMNVYFHRYNAVALVLDRTLTPQFILCSKYYAINTIWFSEDIFKRSIKLFRIDTVEHLGDLFKKVLPINTLEYMRKNIVGW